MLIHFAMQQTLTDCFQILNEVIITHSMIEKIMVFNISLCLGGLQTASNRSKSNNSLAVISLFPWLKQNLPVFTKSLIHFKDNFFAKNLSSYFINIFTFSFTNCKTLLYHTTSWENIIFQ